MGFFSDVFSNPGTGALGGLVVGGPIGALVGGAIGSANQSNTAQTNAAMAQLQQREKERNEAMGYAKKAAEFAAPTGQEIAQMQAQIDNYSRTIALQGANLARQEKLINAVDPALIEAGHQALALLQGKSAPVLNPMLQQRAQDRAKLEGALKTQLGGGYASSTAGIQALNQFDQQTNMLTSQSQAQYMGSLLGVSASVRPDIGGMINNNAQVLNGMSNSILGNAGNIQSRQANAYTNLGNAAGMNSLVGYAGAPYMGDYLNGQMWGGIFNGGLKAAGTIGGAMIGGPMGASAGNQAAPQFNSPNAGVMPGSGGSGGGMSTGQFLGNTREQNMGSYFGGQNPYSG
jgi:hypothetical protein